MATSEQEPPSNNELVAAAALLERKRQAAATYQEARRNQEADGEKRSPSLGTTTGGATPTTGRIGREDQNPLGDIMDALGNRLGKLTSINGTAAPV